MNRLEECLNKYYTGLVEEINKLIAYNGSDKKFNKFSDVTKGQSIDTANFDIPGIYFSSSKEYAKDYACGTTTSMYTDENGEEHTSTRTNEKGYLYTCELNYRKPLVIDANHSNDTEHWEKRNYIAKHINEYKKQGYDIVLMLNWQYQDANGDLSDTFMNEYVVLDPSIIKILDIEECSSEGLEESLLIEKIVKVGSKWQVQSEKGRNLGTYDTKEEAEKRLQQVHYFKYKGK